jgi:hypothetical protein
MEAKDAQHIHDLVFAQAALHRHRCSSSDCAPNAANICGCSATMRLTNSAKRAARISDLINVYSSSLPKHSARSKEPSGLLCAELSMGELVSLVSHQRFSFNAICFAAVRPSIQQRAATE